MKAAANHRVFISYSSEDKALADRVCGALENGGISCWIAPRDIDAGADFPSAILGGIAEAEALVALLTAHATASPHVLSEIEHAFNARKRILPVRLSALDLPPDFEYFLSTPQWLDASSGLTDENLARVVAAASAILAGKAIAGAPGRWKRKAAAGAVIAAALAAAGIFAYRKTAQTPPKAAVSSKAGPSPSNPAGPGTAAPVPSLPAAPVDAIAPRRKTWRNPKDGLQYAWIPPGSFTMGCSAADNECRDDEKPAHFVEIPNGFWLGETEVTSAAYRKLVPSKPSDPSEDPAWPALGLSWPEARAFCAAAGGRLPTEAEWEYAARGGRQEPYYGVPSRIAWYAGNSGHTPHPVGLKQPNAFGLYDMLGNASEWVLDRYYNKYDVEADAVGTHIDLPLPGNATATARGGFWDAELPEIRVSHRSELLPGDGAQTAGVRCANDHRPE